MAKIKIDEKEYDIDKLNQDAKKQIDAIRTVDRELRRLQVQVAIANTAKSVHVGLLKAAINADAKNKSLN